MAARLTEAQRRFVGQQEEAIKKVVDAFLAKNRHVLARHSRSDLMQQGRLTFCKALLSYDGDGVPDVYCLFAIRNELRRFAGQSVKEVTNDDNDVFGALDESVSPSSEEVSLLECVLNRLKPRERQVILMRYGLEGPAQSYAQLAKRLKMSRSGVRWSQKRAEECLARLGSELTAEQQS